VARAGAGLWRAFCLEWIQVRMGSRRVRGERCTVSPFAQDGDQRAGQCSPPVGAVPSVNAAWSTAAW